LFVDGHCQQIGAIGQASHQLVDREDHGLQRCALFAKGLRPLLVIPDIGILEFAQYLGQALFLALVVKDTP
jgi:hypothetical protein